MRRLISFNKAERANNCHQNHEAKKPLHVLQFRQKIKNWPPAGDSEGPPDNMGSIMRLYLRQPSLCQLCLHAEAFVKAQAWHRAGTRWLRWGGEDDPPLRSGHETKSHQSPNRADTICQLLSVSVGLFLREPFCFYYTNTEEIRLWWLSNHAHITRKLSYLKKIL